MQFKGFTLDPFQEEAIKHIQQGNSVVVSAPTGSGKTLIADYIIDSELHSEKRVIYTAPIKALSNQKYRDFCKDYGEDKIGLITGDIVINPGAQVVIMTAEVYRNMAITGDAMLDRVAYCIMDEIHYISDFERGYVWEESIIFSTDAMRFLFLSATIPNADEFASWVSTIKSHKVDIVKSDHRPVPLKIMFFDSELGITTLDKVEERKEFDSYPQYKNIYSPRQRFSRPKPPDFTELLNELTQKQKLPCIYFVFSRLKTQEFAQKMAQKHSYMQNSQRVAEEFRKLSPDVIKLNSTVILRSCLAKGIAFHNAGLLPDLKHIVERMFTEGLIKLLFATETFAVGINMPAKTVCIDSLQKHTGEGFRSLTSKEFFQISGRAGRRGMDKEGLSVSMIYRHTADIAKIKEFTSQDIDPLKSQFRLSYNTILNMINFHSGQEIDRILRMNFFTFQKQGLSNRYVLASIKARFTKAVKLLTKLGYVADNELTPLGYFATKIFSNELEISELFGPGAKNTFTEYETMLVLSSLLYEAKRMHKFFNFHSAGKDIMHKLGHFSNAKWPRNMKFMTSVFYPIAEGKKLSDIMENTSMPEGDIIRLLLQVLDRLEQIDKASNDDALKKRMRNAKHMIRNSLEGIGMF